MQKYTINLTTIIIANIGKKTNKLPIKKIIGLPIKT